MESPKLILPDLNELISSGKSIHPKLQRMIKTPRETPRETTNNLSQSLPIPIVTSQITNISPRSEYIIVGLKVTINKICKSHILTSILNLSCNELQLLKKELEVYNNHADALFNGLGCCYSYVGGFKRKKNIIFKFEIFEDDDSNSNIFNKKGNITRKNNSEFVDSINLSDKKLISLIMDKWDGSLQKISLGYDLLPTFTKYVIMDTVSILKDNKKIKDEVVKYCQDTTGIVL